MNTDTWKCECTNVNTAEPCAKCGKDRPAELTEEERDAWNAYRAGYDDAIINAHPVAIVKALKIYRAARAPLIEAHAREVTEMRGRVENTQSPINALGKARDSETRLATLEQKRAELEKTRASIAKARAGADPRFLAFRLEPATESTVTCAPWLWNMILAELDRCVMVIADLEEKIAGAEPAEKGPDEP